MTTHKTSRPLGLIIAALLSTGLSACLGSNPVHSSPSAFANPIQISESIERLELYSRPTGMELSARDQDAVANFISIYGQYGDGPLYINVPSATASGLGTRAAENLVRSAAAQMGVNRSVQSGQYQSRPGAPAPVVVSYRRLKAIPRNCQALGDMMNTHNNRPEANWGCAHTSNLAAMIENPRQLIEPYAVTSSNAERRLAVHDKYIAGELSAAQFPERQVTTAED